MDTFRKWLNKPKADDKSLLARFYHADRALTAVASELDSFDGRAEPDRCSRLVSRLRQGQDKVLSITNQIMEELLGEDRAPRAFRAKFPEEVLQENLAGQLWFGAECLAAGSSIMNREYESRAMRPLAQAVTKSLDNVRNLLRDQCLRNNTPNSPTLKLDINDSATEQLYESLKIFDRLFAEFELRYVSAMVQVKSKHEYEMQELICVLFSETLQRALKIGLLEQEQVDSYDPSLMFSIPRLAIITGLTTYNKGPLNMDMPADQLSEMFRPFRVILIKIRDLLRALNTNELYQLEKLLCTNEDIHLKSNNINNNNNTNSNSNCNSNNSNNNINNNNNKTSTTIENSLEETATTTTTTNKNNCDDLLINKDEKIINNNRNTNNNLIDNKNSCSRKNRKCSIDRKLYSKGARKRHHLSTSPTSSTSSASSSSISIETTPLTSTGSPASPSPSRSSNTSNASSVWTEFEDEDEDEDEDDDDDDDDEVGNNRDINGHNKEIEECKENLVTADCASGYLIPNTNFGNLLQSNEAPLTDNFIASDDEFIESQLNEMRISLNNNNNDQEKEANENFSPSIHQNYSNDWNNGTSENVYHSNNIREAEGPSCSNRMDTSDSSCDGNERKHRTIKLTTTPTTPPTLVVPMSTINPDSKNGYGGDYSNSKRSHRNRCGRHHSRRHSKSLQEIQPSQKQNSHEEKPKHLKLVEKCDEEPDEETSSGDVSSSLSDGDPREVTLALKAAGRMKFQSTENLLHRLFVCIAGVADQLQTNFASDLRQILRSVFLMNTTPPEDEIKIPEKAKDSDLFEFRASEQNVIHQNGGSNQSIYSAEEVNPELETATITTSTTTTVVGCRLERRRTIVGSSTAVGSGSVLSRRGNSLDTDNSTYPSSRISSISRSRSLGEEENEEHHQEEERNISNFHNNNNQNADSFSQQLNRRRRRFSSQDSSQSVNNSGSSSNTSSGSNSPVEDGGGGGGGGISNLSTAVNVNEHHQHQQQISLNNRQSPPPWIPDEEAPKCMACKIPFTAFRRRHHCRNCGGVFCGNCSNSSAPLPKYGWTKAVRVCRNCYVQEVVGT